MICGQFSIIHKSACANLYALEIMAYSVSQQCCKSHCKNVPIGLCIQYIPSHWDGMYSIVQWTFHKFRITILLLCRT